MSTTSTTLAPEAGTSYDDVLPSLNLVADFGDGWIARFGAAKTMARARIDDMRAAATAGVSPTTQMWSGGGGNPSLEPWRADSGDLSLEKYFGDPSYVALAVFYKDLESYIVPTRCRLRLHRIHQSGSGNRADLQHGHVQHAGQRHWWLAARRGTQHVTGFRPDDGGAGWLRRAVQLVVHREHHQSEYERLHQSGADTLPGLSRDVGNLTLYYEKNGFSARIAERYRSSFRGEITTLFRAATPRCSRIAKPTCSLATTSAKPAVGMAYRSCSRCST